MSRECDTPLDTYGVNRDNRDMAATKHYAVGPLTRRQGGIANERKVQIRWTDKTGKERSEIRWLSQVGTYVQARLDHGDPGPFFWRLHSKAPWHRVKVESERR